MSRYSRRLSSLPRGYSLSDSDRNFNKLALFVKFFIIAIVAVIVFIGVFAASQGVTDDNQARAILALEDEGYTNITLERTYFFSGCGKDDAISYIARATNVKGRRVELIVCMGWWKGVTIRHR